MTEEPQMGVCVKHRSVPTPVTSTDVFETAPDGTVTYFGLCVSCQAEADDRRARSEALLTDIRQERRTA